MKRIHNSAFAFMKGQVESFNNRMQKQWQLRQAALNRLNAAFMTIGLVTLINWSQLAVKADDSLIQLLPASQPTFDTNIRLDNSSYSLLVIEQPKVDIKPGKSLVQLQFEARARQLAMNAVDINPAQPVMVLPAEIKHQMAQEAASKAGITSHWKILDAIWTVESGGSGDTCIVSRVDGRAMGPLQFMPGTFRSHAVDSKANICKVTDALDAAANLLKNNGLADGDVKAAVYSYNHSMAYVNTVKQVADSIQ